MPRHLQFSLAVFLILSLLLPAVAPVNPSSAVFAKTEESFVRLERSVIPISYRIFIEPDLTNKQFSGEETIKVDVKKPVDKIILHAKELDIAEPEISSVATSHGDWLKPSFDFDKEKEIVTFQFKKKLRKGVHELSLKFGGSLNDKLVGFYYSSFKDKSGKEHAIASTQMEPTDARRVFPCFDEPDFKAKFKISIAVDDGVTAISNAPVKFVKKDQRSSKTIYNFEETPKMSTYLVALIVGPFESTEAVTVNKVKIKIWAPVGKKNQCMFARDVVEKLLPFFEDYFGVKYPLNKLDLIAIPDFGPGAMENLGAITFRETRLLVDPEKASTKARQSVASVVAHEMAHMWFGDLVTMKWWDDLWLNEAFATWMSVKAIDFLKPEWKPWDAFISERNYALETDALKATRPIYAAVNDPAEAEEMFDEITYEKGASVLRMLESYLGEDNYKKGIQNYIKENQLSNAAGADLWKALGAASNEPVSKIMESWIESPGYPLVVLEKKENSRNVKIKQSRFSLLNFKDKKANWQIPVTFKSLEDGSKFNYLLKNRRSTIDLKTDKRPYLANANANGFFRVSYSKNDLKELSEKSGKKLNPKERYQMLSDAWAMVEAGNLPIQDYLEFTASYREENDPNVVELLIEQLGHLERFIDNSVKKNYNEFVRDRIGKIALKLGWDAKKDERDLTQLLRGEILTAMGTIGQDRGTIDEARKRFSIYANNPEQLNPNLYDAIVGIVAYNGDARDYEVVQSLWRKSESAEGKLRNLTALCDFRNPSLMGRTLELSLTDEVKVQDAPHLVKHILLTTEGRHKGWSFVKKNWSTMEKKFPTHLFPRVIKGTTSFVTDEDARDLADFLSNHPIRSGARVANKVLESVRVNARVNQKSAKALEEWLKTFKP